MTVGDDTRVTLFYCENCENTENRPSENGWDCRDCGDPMALFLHFEEGEEAHIRRLRDLVELRTSERDEARSKLSEVEAELERIYALDPNDPSKAEWYRELPLERKITVIEAARDSASRHSMKALGRVNKCAEKLESAESEAAALREALEQLQHGPETLTPDGLRIVLAAPTSRSEG